MDNLTEQERRIFSSDDAFPISYEAFLLLYSKALSQNDWGALSVLEAKYKIFFIDAIIAETSKYEPSDNEDEYPYPILSDTNFFTYRRIMNIVTYLTGSMESAKKYTFYLEHAITYTLRTNVNNKEYRCYDSDSLWKDFFLRCVALASAIRVRKIDSIEELVFRAQEYYENAPFDYSSP